MSKEINGKLVYRVIDDEEFDNVRKKANELAGRATHAEEQGDYERACNLRAEAIELFNSMHGSTGFMEEGSGKVGVPALRED